MQKFCGLAHNASKYSSHEGTWKEPSTKEINERKKFFEEYSMTHFAFDQLGSFSNKFRFDFTDKYKSDFHEYYSNWYENDEYEENAIKCNYYNYHYGGYVILSVFLIISSIVDVTRRIRKDVKKGSGLCLKLALDTIPVFELICCVAPVLIGSKELLWLTILLLITRSFILELVQFIACLVQGSTRYITSIENYRDISIIILTIMVVFVPNDYIDDELSFTLNFNIKKLCSTSHMIKQNVKENDSTEGRRFGYGTDVTTKRKLSAFLIVFSWMLLMHHLALHPMLERFNFYLMMFRKVAKRFGLILIFYGLFAVSFAMGFYIIFHDDVGDSILEVDKSSTSSSFNQPYTALAKVAAMFLGEIEFDSMPIGLNHGRKDGFKSQVLAYIFLCMFMFMMVLVLNNLLNGLAVSDTDKIMKDATILHYTTYVDILTYSDSILHTFRSICRIIHTRVWFLRRLLHALDVQDYLLMESDFSGSDDMAGTKGFEVDLDFKERKTENVLMWSLRKISDFLSWHNSDRPTINNIVMEARQIMKNHRKDEIQERILSQTLASTIFSTDSKNIEEGGTEMNRNLHLIKNLVNTIKQL